MSDRECSGVRHPYDPIGPDGKPVMSLSYRNVLKTGSGSNNSTMNGYTKEKSKNHFVKRVSPDEYPLNTSYVFSGNR